MRPADQVQIMLLQECADHVGTIHVADPSVVILPAVDPGLRVRPEEIAEETCDFLENFNVAKVVISICVIRSSGLDFDLNFDS